MEYIYAKKYSDRFTEFFFLFPLTAICGKSIEKFQQAMLAFPWHCPKHAFVILLLMYWNIDTKRIGAALLSETFELSDILHIWLCPESHTITLEFRFTNPFRVLRRYHFATFFSLCFIHVFQNWIPPKIRLLLLTIYRTVPDPKKLSLRFVTFCSFNVVSVLRFFYFLFAW